MATVIKPGTADVQRSFVPVAKHYGATVAPCPPRHGNRKGVVEKAIHYITQGWWRTARISTPAEAQAGLDRFCIETADARKRGDSTVGEVADSERLMTLPPVAYPATVVEVRTVASNALVSLWGNRYSVPPGLVGGHVQIRWRLGTDTVTMSRDRTIVAEHRLAPKGAQRTVRLSEHSAALEKLVLAEFSSGRPCRTKVNRPPSEAALALAVELVGDLGADPVIDLDVYRRIVEGDAS